VTGLFHLIPGPDGKLFLKRYNNSSTPSIRLVNEHYSEESIAVSSDNIICTAIVNYDRLPSYDADENGNEEGYGVYYYYPASSVCIPSKYQANRSRSYRSIIGNIGDAANVATTILTLYQRPRETFTFTTNFDIININLLDKVSINKSIDVNGVITDVYTDDSFLVVGKVINWQKGVQYIMLKDQSTPSLMPIDDHNLQHVQDHNLNEMQT
jgi:hypothetical protein